MVGAFYDVLTASRTTLENITIYPVFPALDSFWTMKFPKLRSLKIKEVWMGELRAYDDEADTEDDEAHPPQPQPTSEEIQARFQSRKKDIVDFFLYHTTLEDFRIMQDTTPKSWMPDSFDPNSLPNLRFFMGSCDLFRKFVQSQLPCLGTSLRGLYLLGSCTDIPDIPPSPIPPLVKVLQQKQKLSSGNQILSGLKSLSLRYFLLVGNSSNRVDDYITSFRLWSTFCGDSLEVLFTGEHWYPPITSDQLVDMLRYFKQLRRLEILAHSGSREEEKRFEGRVRALARGLPKLDAVVLREHSMSRITARIIRRRERFETNIQGGEDSEDVNIELYRNY
jgi:hypothetical protein